MNLTASEAHDWLVEFNETDSDKSKVEFRLYAPNVFLSDLAKTQSLHIGAQNIHPSDFGAFTGEVSIPQLVSVGAQSALIGHSERRMHFLESDAFLKEKVDAKNLGMKTGQGFYSWDADAIKAERQRYDELLRAGLKLIQKELPEIK